MHVHVLFSLNLGNVSKVEGYNKLNYMIKYDIRIFGLYFFCGQFKKSLTLLLSGALGIKVAHVMTITKSKFNSILSLQWFIIIIALVLIYGEFKQYKIFTLDFNYAACVCITKICCSLKRIALLLLLPTYTAIACYINNLWCSVITLHLFSLFWTNFILTVILSFFFYTRLGLEGFFKINAVSVLLFWVFLAIEFNHFICNGGEYTIVFGEFNLVSNCYPVSISLFVDKLSYSFAFLTMSIAVFVFFYTFCYFRYEPSVERLVTLLLLFVNSMILLVLSGNLVVLFLGWELIGVTSFFLINF